MGALPTSGSALFLMDMGARAINRNKQVDQAEHAIEKSRLERVNSLLSAVEKNLTGYKGKVSLADFVRLAELQRQLEQEQQAKEIIVRWVDATETSDTAE